MQVGGDFKIMGWKLDLEGSWDEKSILEDRSKPQKYFSLKSYRFLLLHESYTFHNTDKVRLNSRTLNHRPTGVFHKSHQGHDLTCLYLITPLRTLEDWSTLTMLSLFECFHTLSESLACLLLTYQTLHLVVSQFGKMKFCCSLHNLTSPLPGNSWNIHCQYQQPLH